MFDAQSSQLLRSAPVIPGVVPQELPQILTEVYTLIITERVGNENGRFDVEAVDRLMEIANSYESVAVVIADEGLRKASAFVAGSAYQIMAKTAVSEEQETEVLLTRDHIDGRLAAGLLFLIAEQYPDAREAMLPLRFTRGWPIRLRLLAQSLRDLALENYNSIIERGDFRAGSALPEMADQQDRATEHLYELLMDGLELLAANVLRKESSIEGSPAAIFSSVLGMCTQRHDNLPFPGEFITTYPGPAHLATLLLAATGAIESASIMEVQAPGGANPEIWSNWLQHRAQSKPILWPNHRQAIDTGFLEPGKSAMIVLPTGAGKTTLAEFKIAAVLASGKKAIFLAPTNALVEQLKIDIKAALPEELFGLTEADEGDLFTLLNDTLPGLEVMTPEKCLALLNFNPAAFADVGLLVFDECHILNPGTGSLRRATDGMLVLLGLQHHVPDADFLFLSAMIENINEFSDWIASLTGRECLPINMVWKPSRQARGVVIYSEQELDEAVSAAEREQARADRAASKQSAGVRKGAGELLSARPYALFGLVHNWHPDRPEEIRIRQLSAIPYLLGAKINGLRRIEPTANGNDVSRSLAVACANAGLKTIVFVNTAPWTHGSAVGIQEALTGNVNRNEHEERLWLAIVTEFGRAEHSMLNVLTKAVPHNADLTGMERQLAESLYRRPDGAKVIFATTTLSQGMNLPAQVAILSADERPSLDGPSVTQAPLQAHELLNAAGRAGRAGHLANGLVILVSRGLYTFAGDIPEPAALETLRSIIPENERCVTITDPLKTILDRIQDRIEPDEHMTYIFHRMLQSDNVFPRSFAAFIAEKNNHAADFDAQVALFQETIAELNAGHEIPGWLELLAIQAGIAPAILQGLYDGLNIIPGNFPRSVMDWIDWLIGWFGQHMDAARYCFGRDMAPLASISGLKTITPDNYDGALLALRQGLNSWLSGDNLRVMQESMSGTTTGRYVLCQRAREIAIHVAPRALSYFTTLVIQVAIKVAEDADVTIPYRSALECLPDALKKGFDSPEKTAFFALLKDRYLSRVEAHTLFDQRFPGLAFDEDSTYRDVYEAMRILLGGN